MSKLDAASIKPGHHRSTKELNYFWKLLEKSWNFGVTAAVGSPDVACALSPVLSVSAAEREATDGWCGAAQCGLIINTVLCCRGALDGCCVTSARLNRCLSTFFFFIFFYDLHLSPPPASLLHLQSLSSQPGSPDSPPAVRVRGNNGSCERV